MLKTTEKKHAFLMCRLAVPRKGPQLGVAKVECTVPGSFLDSNQLLGMLKEPLSNPELPERH